MIQWIRKIKMFMKWNILEKKEGIMKRKLKKAGDINK